MAGSMANSHDADDPPLADPANPARTYRDHLFTCRRLGIMRTSPDRAKVLLKQWADALAAAAGKPDHSPKKH